MRRILKNALAAIVQVLISGILLFFLYRFLLGAIGVEELGIWSLVIATTSSAKITELGLSGSVVKFVAKYLALNKKETAAEVIQTAAISLGVTLGLVLLAMILPLHWLLPHILPAEHLQPALILLPYALVSLWLSTLSGVFQSGLDGCQRTDLRGIVNILSSILMLTMALWLVPIYGLTGLAYSQVIIASLLLPLTWIFLKLQLKYLPALPYRFSFSLLREMMGYGLSFQAISIVLLLTDPITKVFLSRFGNLSMVGYYEMASRMTGQLRGLIAAAQQVLVPVIAGLKETGPEKIRKIYLDIYSLQVFISLIFYASIAVAVPIISNLWIGYYETDFVNFSLLLILGWLLNSFIGSAYFINFGIGKLHWNVISHVLIGLGNWIFGILLGMQFGGYGVVVAWILSFSLGSLVVLLQFHVQYKISFYEMYPSGTTELLITCCLGMVGGWAIYHHYHPYLNLLWIAVMVTALYVTCIVIAISRHPLRRHFFNLFMEKQ